MRRPARRLFTLCAAVLLLLCVGTIISLKAAQSLHSRSIAEALRQQAMRESSASTTAADAKGWLERKGFDVAMFYENGVQTGELTRHTAQGAERFEIVTGYRRVRDYPLVGERWVQLTFLFESTQERFVPGAFVRVEVDDNSPPSKLWHNQFARRAAERKTAAAPAPP